MSVRAGLTLVLSVGDAHWLSSGCPSVDRCRRCDCYHREVTGGAFFERRETAGKLVLFSGGVTIGEDATCLARSAPLA
jgi:hypothetical protein